MHRLPLTGDGHGVPQRGADRPIYTPPGGPPQNTSVSKQIHAHMGDENIRAMISDFYDRLADSDIAGLFPTTPEGLAESKDRSASFFIFLLGGPPVYQQKYGPPMMRARHLPFRITERSRVSWLREFDAVLDHAVERYSFPEEHLPGFRAFLHGFSGWMVNTAEEQSRDAGANDG
jgi:hemoglobin